MKLSTKWIVRWAVALGLAGALAFVPLRWAMEDHDEGAVPPEGVERAKLDYTLKDMNGPGGCFGAGAPEAARRLAASRLPASAPRTRLPWFFSRSTS